CPVRSAEPHRDSSGIGRKKPCDEGPTMIRSKSSWVGSRPKVLAVGESGPTLQGPLGSSAIVQSGLERSRIRALPQFRQALERGYLVRWLPSLYQAQCRK